MKKKNENKALTIRGANEFNLSFPENNILKPEETKKIKNAVQKGGIAVNQKTYINEKNLAPVLNTDNKGVQIVMNNAPSEDIFRNGNNEYLSTPQIKKEIATRLEQPRSTLVKEKLNYADKCVDVLSKNPQLEKERTIESDRINQERDSLGAQTIKERKSTSSELSGEPLRGNVVVHHLERKADKPENFRNKENLIVLTDEEHKDFHSSAYLPTKEGFEDYKKSRGY